MKRLKAIKSNRKGQTSVEYLVLLAIAIVIAVVAVGVLSGFIKIGTATTYKKKGNVYWKSADVGIMDWEIYASGTNSTLVLQNNKEYQIKLTNIWADDGANSDVTISIDKSLLPGDSYVWSTNHQNFTCQAGGSYSLQITFQYDNLEHSVLGKKFTGVERLAGTCSSS